MTTRRSDNPFPTADDIAARAHELFVMSGRQLRHIEAHWSQAEQELLSAAAGRAIRDI